MFKTFYIAAATVSAVSIQSASYQPTIVPTTTTTEAAAAIVVDADVRDREAQVVSNNSVDETDDE